MDYTAHMIARAEHQQMVRSLPTISDYEPLPQAKQPIWRRAGRLLQTVWKGRAVAPPSAGQEQVSEPHLDSI